MNNFFCEIALGGTSQSQIMDLANSFSQKFPFQSQACTTHTGANLYLWGNVQISTQEGHSTLYLVGEIYNLPHPAQSGNMARSLHTLVLQGGTNALSGCNGRFFVVYHDLREQTFEVFNDQMGIQQVFYHQHAGGMVLASELKFLLAHPRCPQTINWQQSIRRSLGFNALDHCQHQNAWFMGVDMLPEASRVRIRPQQNEIRMAPYWKPTYNPQPYQNAEEVIEAYMALLNDAVQIRCRDGADAWAFLSGGLDSSIICALAAPATALHTYSALTQTTYVEQTTEMVFELATALGCQNTQVLMPYHRLATDPLNAKKRIWRSESPAAHTDSITKTLLHHAIGQLARSAGPSNARYTLTGTGSDQLNGGLIRWLVNDDDEHPENNWPNVTAKLTDERFKNSVPEHQFTQWGLRHLLADDYLRDLGYAHASRTNWQFYVQNKLYMNQFTLLWDENRAGITQNHSVRYPFLDYRFLELVGNVPTQFHSELFYDKQILRRGSAPYLPESIINKPKAPGNTGDYDNRIAQYRAITQYNNREIVEELMANNGVIGTVISRQKLQAEVERLEKTTDMEAGWQYLMHLLNLGVLEKLPAQTEATMRYEDVLNEENSLFVSALNADTVAQIEAKLNIVTEADKTASVVAFKPGCSLMTDQFSNALYLVKDKVLHYEIDEQEPHWKAFLLGIDGQKTIGAILAQTGGAFAEVQGYLDLCLKEGFMALTTPSINPNPPDIG